MLLLVRRFQSGNINGGIHRSLEKEAEKIQAMYKRPFLVRLANNSVDTGELVSSYRAIKDGLDKFYVSRSCLFFLFQTTGSLPSLQVELNLLVVKNTLLVAKNTDNTLEVCHLTCDREQ